MDTSNLTCNYDTLSQHLVYLDSQKTEDANQIQYQRNHLKSVVSETTIYKSQIVALSCISLLVITFAQLYFFRAGISSFAPRSLIVTAAIAALPIFYAYVYKPKENIKATENYISRLETELQEKEQKAEKVVPQMLETMFEKMQEDVTTAAVLQLPNIRCFPGKLEPIYGQDPINKQDLLKLFNTSLKDCLPLYIVNVKNPQHFARCVQLLSNLNKENKLDQKVKDLYENLFNMDKIADAVIAKKAQGASRVDYLSFSDSQLKMLPKDL